VPDAGKKLEKLLAGERNRHKMEKVEHDGGAFSLTRGASKANPYQKI
jgi:hypothetical protein